MQASSARSLHHRAVGRCAWRVQRYQRILRHLKSQAAQREAALLAELALAQAKIRDLKRRAFATRKSEQSHARDQASAATAAATPSTPARRGQRCGAPGHGRTMLSGLERREEHVELAQPQCPQCGLSFGVFPGCEDSEIIEIDVKAYRRVIHRQRYRPACSCGCVAGIVCAAPVPRLINRGKFGVSVWVTVLLDKFAYGRPSHRLLEDFASHGINMAAGTLTGGLATIAPMFEPIEHALLAKLRAARHWFADETRWSVFVDMAGKLGHRWYMWVFHTEDVVHYALDATRATPVVQEALLGALSGIISCDRYAAYKKFARLNPGVVLAFCWAHERRDFLELATAHPQHSEWAQAWVQCIGELYFINACRLQAPQGSAEYQHHQADLCAAVQHMQAQRDHALADPALAQPCAKVLSSMRAHWAGLSVFVAHPHVPMDNNTAERDMRLVVIGRKNFYGSGAQWSGQLAATMYSLLMTLKLWGINPRLWLTAYLQACADNGAKAPSDISAFLPWAMDEARRAAMRIPAQATKLPARPQGNDSS